MIKSQSLPCHVTSLPPDPFPELSHHKMRLYRFQDVDRAGGGTCTSGTSEAGRTSPSTVSSTLSRDVSVAEASSSSDNITQVLLLVFASAAAVFLDN